MLVKILNPYSGSSIKEDEKLRNNPVSLLRPEQLPAVDLFQRSNSGDEQEEASAVLTPLHLATGYS